MQRKYQAETSFGNACAKDVILQSQHCSVHLGVAIKSGIGRSNGFFGFKEFSNEKVWSKQELSFTSAKLLHSISTNHRQGLSELLMNYF